MIDGSEQAQRLHNGVKIMANSSESKYLKIGVLGDLQVIGPNEQTLSILDSEVSSVLAYLAVHASEGVSRFVLEEMFWPELCSEEQAQKLQQAIKRLHDTLVNTGSVESSGDVISLNAALVNTDCERFWQLTDNGLETGDCHSLIQAIALYRGPVLSNLNAEWISGYRADYEERFGQAVYALCGNLSRQGKSDEAIGYALKAVALAPKREEVHIALIVAYRSAGMESEAIKQYEALETILEEDAKEITTPKVNAADDAITEFCTQATPSREDFESAGGAVALKSRFYVRRESDSIVEGCLDRNESVILINGPRQAGKSSLLARALQYGRDIGMSTALCDLQAMGETQISDESRFYRTIIQLVANQSGITLNVRDLWNDWLGPNLNLDSILGKLLTEANGSLCIAFDETDRLFGRSYTNDFFGLLRSWHNRRALEPGGPWSKLSLVICYATEAHLFITDLNQSPFNVGIRVPLMDFSLTEVLTLAERFTQIDTQSVAEIFEISNGQPYLTRRALAYVAQGRSVSELSKASDSDDGPFADHLKRLLTALTVDQGLTDEVRRLLKGQMPLKDTTRFRLSSSGVVSLVPIGMCKFRVPAYESYLRRHLD